MNQATPSSIDVQSHRYNQVCECLTKLKNIIDDYTVKVKKNIGDVWLSLI
jgi:hypothetical protein